MDRGIPAGKLTRTRIDEFILSVADAKPLPGGGSAAALAGSLAAALGEMMAGLTEGRREYLDQDSRVREIHARLTGARQTLYSLVEEDSTAFQSLLDAFRLPRQTAEERAFRTEAVEKGKRNATETPLRAARAALDALENLRILIGIGNPNARCDAAVGAQLAYASLKGAYYNVRANIRGLEDRSYAELCYTEISELVRKARVILRQIDEIVTSS